MDASTILKISDTSSSAFTHAAGAFHSGQCDRRDAPRLAGRARCRSSAPSAPAPPDVHPAVSRMCSSPASSDARQGQSRPCCYARRSARRFRSPHAEEAAAAHLCFERTGDFDHLISWRMSYYALVLAHSSASCLMSQFDRQTCGYSKPSRIAKTSSWEHGGFMILPRPPYGYAKIDA